MHVKKNIKNIRLYIFRVSVIRTNYVFPTLTNALFFFLIGDNLASIISGILHWKGPNEMVNQLHVVP